MSAPTPSAKMNAITARVNAIIPKLLLVLLKLQMDNIRDRTLDGTDLDGNPFAPYNKQYEKRKMKIRGNLDWLRLTGEMMRSYVARLRGLYAGDVMIGSGSKHTSKQMNELAGWHNFGTKRMPARSFWGYTGQDIDELYKRAADTIKKAIYGK